MRLRWRMLLAIAIAIAFVYFLWFQWNSEKFQDITKTTSWQDRLSEVCSRAQQDYTALLKDQCEKYPPPPQEGSHAAVIVETRQSDRLPVALANVAGVLPDWTLYLLYGDENSMYVTGLPVVERLRRTGHLRLVTLQNVSNHFHFDPGIKDLPRYAYNCLLRTPAFWSCSKAEHILIFQSDSLLCSGSKYLVDDFLGYDYIGAPWPDDNVGNGGLSLRRRQAMLKLLKYTASITMPEDLFFTRSMNRSSEFHIAPVEVASRFATDQVYDESVGIPFGVHQTSSLSFGSSKRLLQNCPEGLVLEAPLSLTTLYNRYVFAYVYWIQHHLNLVAGVTGALAALSLLLWRCGSVCRTSRLRLKS